jgi:hypothetical protein
MERSVFAASDGLLVIKSNHVGPDLYLECKKCVMRTQRENRKSKKSISNRLKINAQIFDLINLKFTR